MRVIVFGGTGEGEEISCRLASEGMDVTVCVATDYGEESQRKEENLRIKTGRQDEEEIMETVRNSDICIDATHPYAQIVSENIRRACDRCNIRLLRYVRPKAEIGDEVSIVSDASEAAELLREIKGNILLTTGSKELHKFSKIDAERLYPRVLPLDESLQLCKKAGIPSKNIIAMQGPFIEELNLALIKQFNIRTMVTKNSGKAGGFEEKVRACKENGCKLIVIDRPSRETGLSSIDEIVKICLEESHE